MIKRLFCLMIGALFLSSGPIWAGNTEAGPDEIIISPISSIDEFDSMMEQRNSPKDTAAFFVLAMITHNSDEALGLKLFTALLTDNQLQDGNVYNGKKPGPSFLNHIKRLKSKPYLAGSYVGGTNPGNGYKLPSPPWTVVCLDDPRGKAGDGRVKLFIPCSGADSPRPITLKKDGSGKWKVSEASSLFVGIRPPEK